MTETKIKVNKEALADLFIERLNEIAKCDPIAIGKLIEKRVECNENLVNHPFVQVHICFSRPFQANQASQVGLLGILNGLIGIIDDGPQKGWGLITAVCEDDGSIVCFRRTTEAEHIIATCKKCDKPVLVSDLWGWYLPNGTKSNIGDTYHESCRPKLVTEAKRTYNGDNE